MGRMYHLISDFLVFHFEHEIKSSIIVHRSIAAHTRQIHQSLLLDVQDDLSIFVTASRLLSSGICLYYDPLI